MSPRLLMIPLKLSVDGRQLPQPAIAANRISRDQINTGLMVANESEACWIPRALVRALKQFPVGFDLGSARYEVDLHITLGGKQVLLKGLRAYHYEGEFLTLGSRVCSPFGQIG